MAAGVLRLATEPQAQRHTNASSMSQYWANYRCTAEGDLRCWTHSGVSCRTSQYWAHYRCIAEGDLSCWTPPLESVKALYQDFASILNVFSF